MESVIERRLRSHRLSAPAASVVDAAGHMLAVQAQEFWGGRWALAARSRGEPTVRDVDAAFDRGRLVRAWTMRGTIHVIPARDLAWVLSVTGERQLRAAASRHRQLGLDDAVLARAETAVRAALRGGGRLTRAELFALLEGIGIDPREQRGVHVIQSLALRAVIVSGPVVPREGGPTREQHLVLAEEWVTDASTPADPLAELFVRYIDGHGPAAPADFAWWAGLPIGMARAAAEAAGARVKQVDDRGDGVFVAGGPAPRRAAATPRVLALPPFEEYFLAYQDRTVPLAEPFLRRVGPGINGIVRPILVADGTVVGVWTHSLAVGRHTDDPVPELFVPDAATPAEIVDALERYRRFITG
ncbi:winged helix DNA-binding domain-containing protein [Microbacterium sp. CJ88]|uniref:winged helix DNA-binding domain-containing protein n=1 Tax=Microbacterium sp. CJ88 TaxID=3445672 RepID=UPI003F65A2A2